ncbi:MAG: C-terminal helicase domain-containing protein, partial [Pseudomonadota bacterium]
LSDPVRIEVSPVGRAADKIAQTVHFVEQKAKTALLKDLLAAHMAERTLVFCRTKHGAERLMKQLVAAGFAADSIHGNKSQGQRDRALKGFKAGKVTVLVATDVAARGIDVPGVRFVYNYELPNVAENYVHRIGRTARAGADGAAVAFCGPHEMAELRAIEKAMAQSIEVAGGTPFAEASGKPGKPGRKPGGGRGPRRRPRRGGKPARLAA